ncbi:hypothetical protein D3C87_2053890 [compost metagenome]
MPSMTCLVTLNKLFRLVSMTARQSSAVIFRNSPSRVIPALLTSTSTGPSSFVTRSKASTVESQSDTLPTDAWNV